MEVREIVKQYLTTNGFDGLLHADTECGCGLNDLAPCQDGPYPDCQAARERVLEPGEYVAECGPGDTVYFAP